MGMGHRRGLAEGIRRSVRSPTLLLVLTVGSVCVNVLQAATVYRLKGSIVSLKEAARLQVGTVVRSFEGEDPLGNRIKVEFADFDGPTLVYLMAPTCSWCLRNNANIRAVIEGASGRYRVLIASSIAEGAADYLQRAGINAPLIVNPSPQTATALRLGGTPYSVLVDRDGKVLAVWQGAYVGRAKTEVEEKLGVLLPGLTDPE